MKLPERVLVLTSSTGAGHDMHALAFAEWVRHLHGNRIEVRIEQLLENSSWFLRQNVRFYNFLQRAAPWSDHLYYNVVEGLSWLNAGGVSFGRAYFTRLLESFRPQVLLSVHDCLNHGYFAAARRILQPAPRCVTFCLEFQGGYGCSRNWADRSADLFLGRTIEAAEFGACAGIPRERCRALGDLFPRRFYKPRLSPGERTRYLAERFGFSSERLTLLLATGGAGAENHRALLDALLGLDLQVIALCGRNGKALAQLGGWRAMHPEFRLHALPFTDEMPELLQVASAVLARGGGTAAEALFCGCPVIFNALGGLMPQEIPTLRYFRKRAIERTIRRAGELAPLLQRWIAHPADYEALRRQVAACKPKDCPEQLVAAVLGVEIPDRAG